MEQVPELMGQEEILKGDAEGDPEVIAAFARAEEGMDEIPTEVTVETEEELAELLGIPIEALHEHEVFHSEN